MSDMSNSEDRWEEIYKLGKPGAFLHYPSEHLVTLFHQNKHRINTHGKVLDYGFGSGNNSEFLIQSMGEFYGIEISEASIDNLTKRFSTQPKFHTENIFHTRDRGKIDCQFDLIVAWQVLYYNDFKGLDEAINWICDSLLEDGVFIVTMITDRDIKVRSSRSLGSGLRIIDERIPHQEGCIVISLADHEAFLQCFHRFNILDFGHYERHSQSTKITASEHYAVMVKK
jgi:SAM-dependent methyltransferase